MWEKYMKTIESTPEHGDNPGDNVGKLLTVVE
jgi:hypothetical protein